MVGRGLSLSCCEKGVKTEPEGRRFRRLGCTETERLTQVHTGNLTHACYYAGKRVKSSREYRTAVVPSRKCVRKVTQLELALACIMFANAQHMSASNRS